MAAPFLDALRGRELGTAPPGLLPRLCTPALVPRLAVVSSLEHPCTVNAISWTGDGSYLISAGDDAKLRIWDASTNYAQLSCFDSVSGRAARAPGAPADRDAPLPGRRARCAARAAIRAAARARPGPEPIVGWRAAGPHRHGQRRDLPLGLARRHGVR
jgi:hypothetical protein